jgi:hypothetical protein
VWEFAGVAGVDPRGFTLRQLWHMTRGRLKSLGIDPDAGAAETIPYDPEAVKQLVASGKLV